MRVSFEKANMSVSSVQNGNMMGFAQSNPGTKSWRTRQIRLYLLADLLRTVLSVVLNIVESVVGMRCGSSSSMPLPQAV